MSLHEILGKDVAFQPHELAAIAAAFEDALRRLGLNDRKDKVTEHVAHRIIDLVQRGERNPRKLCDELLETFQEVLPPRGISRAG